jgi:outer membrane protein OmpA-like peptidoglycan-associated protein
MRVFLFALLMCCIGHAYGQTSPLPAGAQYRYLGDENGQEKKIVYFPATKMYYLCGGASTAKRKILASETLLDKDCDCSTDGLPPLPTSSGYSNIQFDFDSSALRTSSYPVLDATAADLRASGESVVINGFASSEGTASYNLFLSKDRANSVKNYLVNSGVDPKKIKVKAYGETKPVADNSTEEGRVRNRRAEISKH